MPEKRNCQVCSQKFTVGDDDAAMYKKIDVSAPTLCPFDRRLKRLMFRNDRKLYRRPCDLCKKSVVSVYQEHAPFPVYCPECWWDDKWNAFDYGREYDAAQPFFEQWDELNRTVPHIALWQIQNQNSEYSHDTSYNKNCYMLFGADYNQDCYYSWCMIKNNDVCDCSCVYDSQRLYECTDCFTCQFCKYSQLLRNCSSCDFSFDLNNCHFCFGCTGLRNKSYYWFNEDIGKEEFMRRYAALMWTPSEIWKNIQKSFAVSLATPRRAAIFRNCEECTGNYLGNCKNVQESFDCEECRDVKYTLLAMQSKDVWDSEVVYYNIEVVYESQTLIRNCNRIFFSYFLRDAKNAWYSNECYMSSDLFGCVGLRSAHYSILNKQYTKEGFEEKVALIRSSMKRDGEDGQFFPTAITPFAYNETAAMDYLEPLAKEEALARDLRWIDQDPKEYRAQTYVVQEAIKDVPETVTQEILACAMCGKNYKIAPQEYAFYKNVKVPIPRNCFDCRHSFRIRRRGPRTLFDRGCNNCGQPIRTTYAPDRREKVYCEECYLKSVY